jgi:hypothetical protein
MVNIKYEWKFDKAVRANFRMEGDGVRSSVIQLGGGHAVRVHAALEPKIPKFCNQALLFLAIFGEPGGQQRAAFRGRWMVTLGIAETGGMGLGGAFSVTHSFRISRQANYRDTNSDNQQRIAASRP